MGTGGYTMSITITLSKAEVFEIIMGLDEHTDLRKKMILYLDALKKLEEKT